MTVYAILFYILAALILITTALAITRRNMIHTVIYLVFSFFGSAMLFYLLGAPLLAALEVIIYAGAIMILFLFIIMMMREQSPETRLFVPRQWLPAAGIGLLYLVLGGLLIMGADPTTGAPLKTAMASPAAFGEYLFKTHWLTIEIASLLLLIALIGALHLGREGQTRTGPKSEEPS
jgi:NADH-quinone oxidoreductase subunit J